MYANVLPLFPFLFIRWIPHIRVWLSKGCTFDRDEITFVFVVPDNGGTNDDIKFLRKVIKFIVSCNITFHCVFSVIEK